MKSLKTRLVFSMFAAAILCASLVFPGSTSARPDVPDPKSPIIWDITGNGVGMCTTPIYFNFDGVGNAELINWTSGALDDAFLVLDRNLDGEINSGMEMFGDVTPQPPAPSGKPNGFNALAVFDVTTNGGNNNGYIDPGDDIWDDLRLWADINRDGHAIRANGSSELFTLDSVGLLGISLAYSAHSFSDGCGNHVGYQTNLVLLPSLFGQRSTRMHDVFLAIHPN